MDDKGSTCEQFGFIHKVANKAMNQKHGGCEQNIHTAIVMEKICL